MRYRVRRHPRVVDDLRAIGRLIRDYAGAESAEQALDAIDRAILSLEAMPNRAAPRPDVLPGLRILPAAGNALIIFRVDDDSRTVFVRLISYAGAGWMLRIRARG